MKTHLQNNFWRKEFYMTVLNPLNTGVFITQFAVICCANQLTGIYMRATLAFNGSIVGKCLENEIIGLTPITRGTIILSKITRQSEIKPSKETKKQKTKKKKTYINHKEGFNKLTLY